MNVAIIVNHQVFVDVLDTKLHPGVNGGLSDIRTETQPYRAQCDRGVKDAPRKRAQSIVFLGFNSDLMQRSYKHCVEIEKKNDVVLENLSKNLST